MTEDLVLLAVTGDTCGGPAHLPARERRIEFVRPVGKVEMRRMRGDHRMQSFEEKIRLGGDCVPYSWPAMCGAEGEFVVFARGPDTVSGGECFTCRMVAAKPARAEYGRASRQRMNEGAA